MQHTGKWVGLAQTLFSKNDTVPAVKETAWDPNLPADLGNISKSQEDQNVVPLRISCSPGATSRLTISVGDAFQGHDFCCSAEPQLASANDTASDTPRSAARTPRTPRKEHQTRQEAPNWWSPRIALDPDSAQDASPAAPVLLPDLQLQPITYFRQQVRLGSFWAEILLRAEAQKLWRAASSARKTRQTILSLADAIILVSRACETGMRVEDVTTILEKMRSSAPCLVDDWETRDEDRFVHAIVEYFGLDCEECNRKRNTPVASTEILCTFCKLDELARSGGGCVPVTSELLNEWSQADLKPCMTCLSQTKP